MALDRPGYIKPESSFATITEWEDIAKQFLALQSKGYDTRGGMMIDNPQLASLVERWFGFQLHVVGEKLLTGKSNLGIHPINLKHFGHDLLRGSSLLLVLAIGYCLVLAKSLMQYHQKSSDV